jgi:RNA polymerase sigma factor (sigma-70 family)
MTRLHRAQRPGDAFGAFYDRHVASVLAYFRRRTGDAELAMDLTAETFARALEARAGRDLARREATGWLLTIAHNLLVDSYRRGQVDDRARRRLALDPLVLTDDGLDAVDEAGDRGERELSRLLAGLPPEQREAIEQRVVEEKGYPEIAAALRCSESVVRKRVSRGLATLRARIVKEEGS